MQTTNDSGRLPETSSLPLRSLIVHPQVWPRGRADQDRIELFADILRTGKQLPPIEVTEFGDGRFIIADGVHRAKAAGKAGITEILAVVVAPSPGETPVSCAYLRALATATQTALPLTGPERRRAALHLLDTRSDLSRRAIARLVGVAHSSVDRWAEEPAESASAQDDDPRSAHIVTAQQMTRRLVVFLARLDEARGLLDYVMPTRMGRHIANAFTEQFGDSALTEAQRFRAWLDQAVASIEHEGAV